MASFYYNEKHSMQIIPDDLNIFKFKRKNGFVSSYKVNGVNTWKDWHLIPSSRPIFNAPKVKTNYIDLPGANGAIDATQALSNYIYYQNREGSNEFYVANGFGDWATRFSEIMNYLHGKRVKVILGDDPGFYYRGRLAVNQWKSEKDFSKIVIDYVLDPYKYEVTSTNDDWLWDPFNFYTGIIRKKSDYTDVPLITYGDLTLNYEMNFYPRAMPVVPTITIKPTYFAESSSSSSSTTTPSTPEESTSTKRDAKTLKNYELAFEVIEGYWDDGDIRVTRLTEAGYDYQTIQDIVNVCYEVDAGEWGEGEELKTSLTNAGYDYECIMAVIQASYTGEYIQPVDPDPEPEPSPDPEPAPEPLIHEITISTATAKGKKGTKKTIILPKAGSSRTYRYPDLIISEQYPKLIFTIDAAMSILVTVNYRGGML